ncbi:MAG: restriction endonuclease [Rhodospirillales bacterium]
MIDALKALGDSGRPREVCDWIASKLKLTDAELSQTGKNGLSRFENQVAWARFYLAKGGFIDASRRGVWILTDSGRSSNLTHEDAQKIVKEIRSEFHQKKEGDELKNDAAAEAIAPTLDDPFSGHFRDNVSAVLRSLSSAGFEKFAMRLLREVGFEKLVVTGKSGDGGIDGKGTLRLNRVISERVVFQCKRHTKNIGTKYIRDFRGAMDGRTQRGVLITTARFSAEAQREAERDGAIPIDLLDIDQLIDVMVDLELGVTTQKKHSVDRKFFEDFSDAKLTIPKSGT